MIFLSIGLGTAMWMLAGLALALGRMSASRGSTERSRLAALRR